MSIEAVDLFYLSMPVVTDAGDGSQDVGAFDGAKIHTELASELAN